MSSLIVDGLQSQDKDVYWMNLALRYLRWRRARIQKAEERIEEALRSALLVRLAKS